MKPSASWTRGLVVGALLIASAPLPGDAQTPANTRQMRRNPFVLSTPVQTPIPQADTKHDANVGNPKDVKVQTQMVRKVSEQPSLAARLKGVAVVGILEGNESVALLQEGASFDTVRPGDDVHGFRVTGVGRGRVSLMRDGEVVSLRLHNASSTPGNLVNP